MALPYQCIEAYNISTDSENAWVLVGASGSKLVTQSSTGATSIWPREDNQVKDVGADDGAEGPPGKRIKLTPTNKNNSNSSCLTVSNDKKHLVAVTAEDKYVRVFQISSNFELKELSQRCMARRPCSIALTSDDSMILCADKFGDVYSLPLIPPPEDEDTSTPNREQDEPATEKTFAPSASVLTVHSGRNRKVLEDQMKQAAKGLKRTKEPMKFKHDLLLGHVSMLTDIAYAKVDGRSYILTADRDEHVRISRGPPQGYIIEGFCHGHEAFVSRLCLTPSGLLVSGGGDAHLFVWDWVNHKLLKKIPIRDEVLAFLKSRPELASRVTSNEDNFEVAVSGIWAVPQFTIGDIFVACEGVSALFKFTVEGPSTYTQTLSLTGNALDVTFICTDQENCTAVVSVDNVHVACSTTEVRDNRETTRLQCFSPEADGQWFPDWKMGNELKWFSLRIDDADSAASESNANNAKAVKDILYGIENLRKRPGGDDQE